MEARSYVENIANRTTMRAVIATMTKLLLVVVVVAALGLLTLTNGHPAALIIGVVLLGGGVVLGRDVVLVGRDARANPLDLAFEPAPDKGLVTPGTVFGIAIGMALFGGVLAGVTTVLGQTIIIWTWVAFAIAAAFAVMGIPTLGVQGRKWRVLADTLRANPRLIEYLRDARARFPKDAPFPFSAPTDQVTIP